MKFQTIHIFVAALLAYALFATCSGKEGYRYKTFADMKVKDNKIGETLTGMTAGKCKKACNMNKKCKGFVMKSNGECNLKSKGAPRVSDPGKTFHRKMTKKMKAKRAAM